MNNKKYKDIFYGILMILLGVIIGVVISLIVVESEVKSSASNDGWIGFIGGMVGSIISGFIAIYILYINRKDAESISEENRKSTIEIQEQNHKEFISSKQQNSNILLYKVHKEIGDELISLVSELISIAEDYYLNVADNTYGYYRDKVNRSKEIVSIIEIKLGALNDENNKQIMVLKEYIKSYCSKFIDGKANYYRKVDDIVPESREIKAMVMELYRSFLEIKV